MEYLNTYHKKDKYQLLQKCVIYIYVHYILLENIYELKSIWDIAGKLHLDFSSFFSGQTPKKHVEHQGMPWWARP